jgi:hypothetical protein
MAQSLHGGDGFEDLHEGSSFMLSTKKPAGGRARGGLKIGWPREAQLEVFRVEMAIASNKFQEPYLTLLL